MPVPKAEAFMQEKQIYASSVREGGCRDRDIESSIYMPATLLRNKVLHRT